SSSYLEIAATEFECQGLEIDEVGLCWGGDFLPSAVGGAWCYQRFHGSKWVNANGGSEEFITSKYRVLLTRARTGLVIWVPPASATDETIDDEGFDLLYQCLISAGVRPL